MRPEFKPSRFSTRAFSTFPARGLGRNEVLVFGAFSPSLKASAYSKRCGQPNEVLVPAPLAPENVGADHEFNARFSHAGCGIPRTRDYEHDPLYS